MENTFPISWVLQFTQSKVWTNTTTVNNKPTCLLPITYLYKFYYSNCGRFWVRPGACLLSRSLHRNVRKTTIIFDKKNKLRAWNSRSRTSAVCHYKSTFRIATFSLTKHWRRGWASSVNRDPFVFLEEKSGVGQIKVSKTDWYNGSEYSFQRSKNSQRPKS